MKDTYGPDLKFVAFEVKMGDTWFSVPTAAEIVKSIGLEFVHFEKGPATLEWLNEQRDKDSTQAIRNGMGPGKMSEGIVVRPPIELTKNGGGRLIVKHKRPEFRETRTPREVDPEKLKVLSDAREVAREWVTECRLDHVLDKLAADSVDITSMSSTGQVVKAMIKDVRIEGEGEIVWSSEAQKCIGKTAAQMYKKRISKIEI